MSGQLDVFGGETPLEQLGSRQEFVLSLLRTRGGMDADEVGAAIHAARAKHPEEQRCRFCAREGNDVLRSLRSRGLVVHRRYGSWELVDAPPPTDANATAPGSVPYGEFPEGF